MTVESINNYIYIFDTDCLSTFLRVNCENVLLLLFKNIIIPQKVYNELCYFIGKDNKPLYKEKIDRLISSKQIKVHDLEVGSNEWKLYFEMTNKSEMKGIKVIGYGEAACIAFAIINEAIVCSNNLSDIMFYVKKYNLKYITTAIIFCYIHDRKLMGLYEIEKCWDKIKKYSKLPTDYFIDYYDHYYKNNS